MRLLSSARGIHKMTSKYKLLLVIISATVIFLWYCQYATYVGTYLSGSQIETTSRDQSTTDTQPTLSSGVKSQPRALTRMTKSTPRIAHRRVPPMPRARSYEISRETGNQRRMPVASKTTPRRGETAHRQVPSRTNTRLKQPRLPTSFNHISSGLKGFDGLSCESSVCTGANCIHLYYLWKMARLYASFHANGIKQIRDGHSSSVRTLTWYCGGLDSCGGLGYRFQGMTVTWILGMLTGRVVLFKWSRESTENKHLMPNMFDWRYLDYKFEGSTFNVGNFANFIENFGVANMFKYHHKLLNAVTGNTMHVLVHYNLLVRLNDLIFKDGLRYKLPCGNIPGMKLPSPSQYHPELTESVGILSMFNFTDKLKSYIHDVQLHLQNVTNGSRYVALHLRTGSFDDLFEPKIQARTAHRSDWKIAAECAIKQANKHVGLNSTIIVVSDSTEAKRWIVQEYPRMRTFETKIVHLDMSATVDEEGMLGVWQDITLLAQAQVLVKHVSTFSDIPALMCRMPSNRIIDYAVC